MPKNKSIKVLLWFPVGFFACAGLFAFIAAAFYVFMTPEAWEWATFIFSTLSVGFISSSIIGVTLLAVMFGWFVADRSMGRGGELNRQNYDIDAKVYQAVSQLGREMLKYQHGFQSDAPKLIDGGGFVIPDEFEAED